MMPRAPKRWNLVLAALVGCKGDCQQNAVAVVEQLQAFGPTMAAIVETLGALRRDPSGRRTLPDIARCMLVEPDRLTDAPLHCRKGEMPEIWTAKAGASNVTISYEACRP